MQLFRDVAHEHGTTVIAVTHDHRALNVFDTVYQMQDGALHQASHIVGSAEYSPLPH